MNYRYLSIAFVCLRETRYVNNETDPAPRGAYRGRAPQMTACAPPNKNCAPQARTVPRRH